MKSQFFFAGYTRLKTKIWWVAWTFSKVDWRKLKYEDCFLPYFFLSSWLIFKIEECQSFEELCQDISLLTFWADVGDLFLRPALSWFPEKLGRCSEGCIPWLSVAGIWAKTASNIVMDQKFLFCGPTHTYLCWGKFIHPMNPPITMGTEMCNKSTGVTILGQCEG